MPLPAIAYGGYVLWTAIGVAIAAAGIGGYHAVKKIGDSTAASVEATAREVSKASSLAILVGVAVVGFTYLKKKGK